MGMTSPVRLAYTFGNHMHWVDMEWLWGYDVLPGSTRDMLRLAREAQVRGNVNFDGIGYEKMASEAPEALADLREAIARGEIEVVGGSYGQPYGLFHGGESNLRQRVYGARTVRRLLGVWPRTFWEEEFDFFPQLPQMLAEAGFTGGSLFFQWTWHTPEIPREDTTVIRWRGLDGTTLPVASRNRLNLHQWPEDMQILLDELAAGGTPVQGLGDAPPLIQQWVELMPSPDWMCRSEVLLPPLRALLGDPRFTIQATTLGEYLANHDWSDAPERAVCLDEVWHGMSLGKNGDRMRRRSREVESALLTSETTWSVLGLFGRPYVPWDVYPVWELEEGWRHLLMAQHHDNDECEALCGYVGDAHYDHAERLALGKDALAVLHARVNAPDDRSDLAFNALGWAVRDVRGREIPAAGYVACREPISREPATIGFGAAPLFLPPPEPVRRESGLDRTTITCGSLCVEVDSETNTLQVKTPTLPEGLFADPRRWLRVAWISQGDPVVLEANLSADGRTAAFVHPDDPLHSIRLTYGVRPEFGALEVWVEADFGRIDPESRAYLFHPHAPDAGMNAGYRLLFEPNLIDFAIRADSPYAIQPVRADGSWPRKYPTGDWMTSEQWFETVERSFTSLSLVDLGDAERGVLIVHDSSPQWFRTERGVANLLSMFDPWDNGELVPEVRKRFLLLPRGPLDDRKRWMIAQSYLRAPRYRRAEEGEWRRRTLLPDRDLPAEFGGFALEAEHSTVTAFYREAEAAGAHLDNYAGRGMGYPYILRLVEWNGVGETVRLRFPSQVANAYRTDARGHILAALSVQQDTVEVALRPHEIATLYLDLVAGRKQPRDLDAKRHVWATVHRTAETQS